MHLKPYLLKPNYEFKGNDFGKYCQPVCPDKCANGQKTVEKLPEIIILLIE
jgi:hypothetical protein